MNQKVVLKDAFKGYTLDQDKIISPEETVRRFKNKLKEVNLDILERTIRIDNGRLDIPVFFSICGSDGQEIIGTKKQMGKGGTPQQSEASAVMELAERFSFFSFWKNEKNFFTEEYRNLKDRALSFEAIAKSVHDETDDLIAAREIFSTLPLKWTRAYNLTREEEVLIPFNWFYAINEFNGPCAGNCAEEALIQGICEVVERHVSALISRKKLKTDVIDKGSITDPLVLEMLGKYNKAGVKLYLSDFSLDTGIPSVGALAFDPETFPLKSEIVWTAGTSPDPQKALSRALTEVAQLAGDFNSSSNYVASGLPKFGSIAQADFIMEPDGFIDIKDLPDVSNNNIRIEVENCVSTLSERGMEILVVDVMHPLLKIPAFYTIIPGAQFRERAIGTSVGMFSAKLISENENPDWAISRLHEMDRIMPNKYYIKFYLGLCHLAMGRIDEAKGYLNEALELDPKREDIPTIYSYLAQCYKESGQFREAIGELRKAEEYDDERTDIYNLLGFCHFKLRQHEEAIECFKKVLKLDPTSAIDYANIASNYRDMSNKELAIRYYRLALDLDPTIEFARDNLMLLTNDDNAEEKKSEELDELI